MTEPDGGIRAAQIELPSNVTLLTDPEDVVIRIEVLRAMVEEEGVPQEEAAETPTESEGGPEA